MNAEPQDKSLLEMREKDGEAAARVKMAEAEDRVFEVDGHRLTLFFEGHRRLQALIDHIDGAKTKLRLLYYVFCEDDAGKAVKAAILRAVARGVDVSLLVDGFGSGEASDEFFGELEEKGVHFIMFFPRFGRRYLIRNHQKMAIADEDRALVGGFNVEQAYFEPPEQNGWRDTGLLVEGPAAARLIKYYDALFEWACRKKPRMRDLRKIIHEHSETEGPLQWCFGGPTRHLSPWARTTCRDLDASKCVEFVVAYFAPTRGMLRRIENVVRRGGRARIITAAKSDNDATIAAARHTYRRLLQQGVEIFEYQPCKLHAKIVILDDVVHLGSSNFDIRSLYLNLEMMLRVHDEEFSSVMRSHFEQEIDDSEEITPSRYRKMATWWARLKWAASFFLVTSADYTLTRKLNFGLE